MGVMVNSHNEGVGYDPSSCCKSYGAEKIYEKEKYIVLRAKSGFIVYNTKKVFSEGHTHLNSFNMAKVIIENNLKKKRPKTNNLYILESHIRVSDDLEYIKIIEELIAAKKNKSKDNKYYNRKY